MNYNRELRELRQRRDAEIRRLYAEQKGLLKKEIAVLVGCDNGTVEEVLDPGLHKVRAKARRDRWRRHTLADTPRAKSQRRARPLPK